MSRKNKSTYYPPTTEAAAEETATLPEVETPSGPAESNGVSQTKDRTNPPYYVVMGTNRDSGQTIIVWEYPTIGQARKGIEQVQKGFGGFVKDMRIVKCKNILPEDSE